MNKNFDAICGLTEKELNTYFADSIMEFASELSCSEVQMKDILKKQYDGYHFSNKMIDVYNPFNSPIYIECFDIQEGRDTYE